jgi:lysophospholipase L1-like esterase
VVSSAGPFRCWWDGAAALIKSVSSITEQFQYSNYIELYLTTHFPDWGMSFLNAGISGDTATGGARRFDKHVLAEKPTAVTIDFGMNDGGYGSFNAAGAANFVKNTEVMLEKAEKAGVRVALISPNAVEVRARPGLATYLETQKQFYAPLAGLAKKHRDAFVDQYAVTRAVLEKIAADKAKVSPFPDGVHTSEAGGLLMAHTILVGLNAPAVVSDVHIDAKAKKVEKAVRCKVDGLSVADGKITFNRLDKGVPMPVLKGWRPLLPYVNDLKDLNYYGLKVTGLPEGKYRVSVGGTAVGTWTADQLAAGVNLGNAEAGPLYQQGTKVLGAIAAKNRLVHQRFRGVVMGRLTGEAREQELKKRKEAIDKQQAAVYELARPATQAFEIAAVK